MAMTTGYSKFAMKMNFIYIVVCLACTLWLVYDGYFKKEFIAKNTREDGTPNVTLQINKTWGPISCVVCAIWFGYAAMALSRRKLIVDEKGLTFEDGTVIELDSLTKIDKSKFKASGKILIDYEVGGETKTLKLRDSVYDDVPGVLDEILKLTGKGDKQEQSTDEPTSKEDSPDKTKDNE